MSGDDQDHEEEIGDPAGGVPPADVRRQSVAECLVERLVDP
jgi:hypothetical protein